MIKPIFLVAIAFCVGACASSGPKAPASAAAVPAENVDAVAANTDPAASEGEIHDLDAPNVELTEAVTQNDENEVVCRREIITGTRMSHRVCRRRADIEAAEEDGQDALQKMRRSGSQLESGASN
jgi:transcriptional regulator of NAD metabolism